MHRSASWSVSSFCRESSFRCPADFLGRRFGDKTIVVYGMALMVAGGGVATFGWSYPTVLIGHALAGVGGAILIVLMSKMLTDWFARKELFLGNAIFIVGWPAGIAAGQATQSRMAELISWHTVFASSPTSPNRRPEPPNRSPGRRSGSRALRASSGCC
jgi:MFS family permease